MTSRSPSRAVIRVAVAAALLSSCLWTAGVAVLGANLPVFFVSPDPEIGKDESGYGLSSSKPFLTIQYSLDRAAEKVKAPEYTGAPGARLNLLKGDYTDDPGPARQAFPVNVPAALERVELVGPDAPKKATIRGSNANGVSGLLELAPYTAVKGVSIEFRNIDIVGGFSGISMRGVESEDLNLKVVSCNFIGQAGTGFQFSSRANVKAAVSLSDCAFQGGSGGVIASSGEKGELRITIEGCAFTDLRKYAPRGMLGAGVDLYLEPYAKIRAVVARNQFRGVASAVQLTEAEEDMSRQPTGGELHALVVSNLVNGLPSVATFVNGPDVTNAIYLNLWPHHRNDVLIVNNTFVGVSRHVLYHDNLLTLAESGLGLAPVTFANNICHATGGESEFDDEVFAFENEGPGEHFASSGSVIRSNILEKSRRGLEGLDGNANLAPLFVNEIAFDFRLQDGSPAIDKGDPAFGGPFDAFGEPSLLDVGGKLCRRATETCSLSAATYPIDIGAHEHEGLCDVETAVFTRGDCNSSKGLPRINDPIFTFSYLFTGGDRPPCQDACDSNDDGAVNISDGIYTLSFLFLGGPPPPPPYDVPGSDPTRDCLPPCK